MGNISIRESTGVPSAVDSLMFEMSEDGGAMHSKLVSEFEGGRPGFVLPGELVHLIG